MGMGKTLSMLALVIANPCQSDTSTTSAGCQHGDSVKKATLIVAPVVLLQVWINEILRHCREGQVRYQVFHGPDRYKSLSSGEPDIILTTYQTLALEWKRHNKQEGISSGTIFATMWHRVVLDEAHFIRNRTGLAAKAVHALKSQRRWCMTGTPIQNKLTDLFSLFWFLKLDPFGDWKVFQEQILSPWKLKQDDIASDRLQSIMKSIAMSRSRKRFHLFGLKEYRIEVSLYPEERELYQKVGASITESLNTALSADQKPSGSVYFSYLRTLNALRYICSNGVRPPRQEAELQASGVSEVGPPLSTVKDAGAVETPEPGLECYALLSPMTPESGGSDNETLPSLTSGGTSTRASSVAPADEAPAPWVTSMELPCAQCGVGISDPVEEKYGFGMDVEVESIPSQLCKNCLNRKELPFLDETNAIEAGIADNKPDGPNKSAAQRSSKIEALLAQITQVPANEKSVVLSCWTNSLDVAEHELTQVGIPSVRYDGRLSLAERSQAAAKFADEPSIRVILVSIASIGLGMGLTAANHIFLLEPQWNPMLEAQAVARVVRIGQRRQVSLYRFIVKDTCEELILSAQEKKLTLANLVVDRAQSKDGTVEKSQLAQLRALVG